MTVVAGRRTPWLLRRWAALAGIVFGGALALAFARGFSDSAEVAQVLTAAGFVYLGAAALGRPSLAWPLFGVTFVLIGVGALVDGFNAFWALVVLAIALAVVGVVRGAIRPPWGLPLQAAAMAAIIGIALVVAALGQPWAGVLVGLGLLGHAVWDARHLRARRVVAPSMAEFCCALDALLGAAVIGMSVVA
ncbi:MULTISPECIES: hypothetical protein [Microbacterium]|uniref:hypothetical protein n=1 Tax=Microbacterium barkeri TaxID=33917 RepID=UPI0024AFE344|nr:hypothetical protein [Microbacterium barkeri]MDI6944421.1 hypothetical protein [Microbacterium barkeri]